MHINKTSRPIHPAIIIALFWIFICGIYLWGPIYLTPAVSLPTFAFLGLHILLFILGSILFTRVSVFKPLMNKSVIISFIPNRNLYQIIFIILFIGICGELMTVYSKLSAIGGFDFQAITKFREDRAQALLAGADLQSTPLSALAFLIYPAGFAGAVAGMFFYEKIPFLIKAMFYAFVINVFSVSLCMGGRSPILVLFILMAITFYARGKAGEGYIPKSLSLQISMLAVIILFIAYSSYVWVVRAEQAKMSTQAMLEHAATIWGAHPKECLLSINNPQLIQSILGSTFYLIQNLSVAERLLSSYGEVPTMYGAYQIDLLAALFRAFPHGAEFLKSGYDVLLSANVYGFFTGAWAGLYLDIWIFSLLAAVVWGAVAGKAWLNFGENPNLLTGVKYIFWAYSIFISFVSGPFGFSNSLMIFAWFLVFTVLSLSMARYKIIPMAYKGEFKESLT